MRSDAFMMPRRGGHSGTSYHSSVLLYFQDGPRPFRIYRETMQVQFGYLSTGELLFRNQNYLQDVYISVHKMNKTNVLKSLRTM